MNPLGKNVARLRKAKHWSQLELRRRSGVHVHLIESGARPNAQHKTVAAIAEALGVEVHDLYKPTKGENNGV